MRTKNRHHWVDCWLQCFPHFGPHSMFRHGSAPHLHEAPMLFSPWQMTVHFVSEVETHGDVFCMPKDLSKQPWVLYRPHFSQLVYRLILLTVLPVTSTFLLNTGKNLKRVNFYTVLFSNWYKSTNFRQLFKKLIEYIKFWIFGTGFTCITRRRRNHSRACESGLENFDVGLVLRQ